MKICVILRSHLFKKVGGAELQSYYISEYLSRMGHEVHFIFENEKEIDYHGKVFLHFLKPRGSVWSFLNIFQLKKIIKEISPDIIYQRCGNYYTGMSVYLANRMNIPVVFASASENDVKRKRHYDKNNFFRLIKNFIINYGIINATEVIVQSKKQKEMLRTCFNKESVIINNSLPPIKMKHNQRKRKKILWVSNLKPIKQPEIFLTLSEYLHDAKVDFQVIGNLTKDDFGRKIYQRMSNNKHLEYLGFVHFEEVNKYFKDSSILVNTSLYEGFPNTFLQAWMNGVPVVSLNIDPDDIIKENDLGIVVNTEKELFSSVKDLILDDERRKCMGLNAIKYFEKNHNSEKIIKSYEIFFENIIGRNRK